MGAMPQSVFPSERHSAYMKFLGHPAVDRAIATVASIPFVYFGYKRYLHGGLTLPLIVLWIELAMLIVPMLVRRPPKRITTNPWFWLLTYIETYWLIMPILGPGHPIVSRTAYDLVALVGLGICVFGRISLGRNIGFVPAQRELVVRGAYKYVRHPLYTSLLVVYLSTALANYSVRNVVLIAIGMFWFLLKSMVEESFLKSDPRYAAYMQRVRARWIPFVI
jgi:protein-S-isoprenylcysteine O-methyltransferase Ste14